MSLQPLQHSDADEPLDAIVYDVHPALAPRPANGSNPFATQPPERSAYPYGAPLAGESAAASHPPGQPALDVLSEMLRPLRLDLGRKADYVVPQRFGMSALLGIMTALAVLFGGLRLLDAPPSVYLFFGLQAVIICVAQMFQGHSPRTASAIAGAILLPLFVFFAAIYSEAGPPLTGLPCVLAFCIPGGAFLGYLTGTCAAGVFLVMDALERYVKGQRPLFQTTAAPMPGAARGGPP